MAELMAKMGSTSSFVTPKKGEQLKGIITKLTPQEITIDINAKSEAKVLEKDPKILKVLLNTLSVGQEVTVGVLNPESDSGNPVVSLRRFIEDILWKELEASQKENKKIQGVLRDVTRGGFLVDTQMGFNGFLPNSQVTFQIPGNESQSQELIGKRLEVYILEHQRASKKIIFTQKGVMDVKAFEEAVSDLKVGQKVQGLVTNSTSFGVFVSLHQKPTIDALIHISEVAWEEAGDLQTQFTPGMEIEAVIIGFDKNSKRIELSIKRLTADPFAEVVKQFALDQKISGTVKEVTGLGVMVDIEAGEETLDGMIRKEKIPVGTVYEKGQEITATVSQIDTKRRKIYLVPVMLRKSIGYR